nr:glycosyltransferase family 2 protein [uncultured Anaerostipes sp.]
MVAIVLVNFNGAEDTIECLSSLADAKINGDNQVIVVDNKSTDDSIERLQYAREEYNFILLESDSNVGFAGGNNIGIKYALEHGCEYILLLNNDTVVEQDFLQQLLSGFNYSENAGMTTCKILLNSSRDTVWYDGGALSKVTGRTEHFNYGKKDSNATLTPREVTFASGCCMCLSRKAIQTVGLLNEDFFLYEEDTDYCYMLTKAGLSIVYVPQGIIYHKVSASTGQGSPMSQYYAVRNKYWLIQNNFRGVNKILAYLYSTAQMLFRCMKHELDYRCFKAGYRDFRKGIKGKIKI